MSSQPLLIMIMLIKIMLNRVMLIKIMLIIIKMTAGWWGNKQERNVMIAMPEVGLRQIGSCTPRHHLGVHCDGD